MCHLHKISTLESCDVQSNLVDDSYSTFSLYQQDKTLCYIWNHNKYEGFSKKKLLQNTFSIFWYHEGI